MQETKFTRDRIRNHFTYSWWKYLLLAVFAIVGWNLIYTSTAYKAPKDKRLDVFFVSGSLPEETAERLESEILARYPEVEDSQVSTIVYTADDNYYGSIQLTTYLGAGEGDVIILPKERFDAFAVGEGFLALDDAIADGRLDVSGIDLSRGTVTSENGKTAVYGIPATTLYGMMGPDYGIDNRELVIAVLSYTKNGDTAIDWVNWFVQNMKAPKPDWLVEYEQKNGLAEDGEVSAIPSF